MFLAGTPAPAKLCYTSDMQLTPDELRALQHRPLFNLLSQIIMSVGQPMPRYYMQQPDGSMVNMISGGNGCAAFVSRMLAAQGVIGGQRLIDGPHGTVSSTVKALQVAGWQLVTESAPKPGDVLVWEQQQQVDGQHVHIGFSVGNSEAVSTNFIDMVVDRHADNSNPYGGERKVEQILRYSWSGTDYDALAHLNSVDGAAV